MPDGSWSYRIASTESFRFRPRPELKRPVDHTKVVNPERTLWCASSRSAKEGRFLTVIRCTWPSRHCAVISTRPPGASSLNHVSGSRIVTMPVSRRTVATQIEFEPDIGGVSSGSMTIVELDATAASITSSEASIPGDRLVGNSIETFSRRTRFSRTASVRRLSTDARPPSLF